MASLKKELETKFVGKRVRITDSDQPDDVSYGVCMKISKCSSDTYNLYMEGQRRYFSFRPEQSTPTSVEGKIDEGVTRKIELYPAGSVVIAVWGSPSVPDEDPRTKRDLAKSLEDAVRIHFPLTPVVEVLMATLE